MLPVIPLYCFFLGRFAFELHRLKLYTAWIRFRIAETQKHVVYTKLNHNPAGQSHHVLSCNYTGYRQSCVDNLLCCWAFNLDFAVRTDSVQDNRLELITCMHRCLHMCGFGARPLLLEATPPTTLHLIVPWCKALCACLLNLLA